MCSLELSLRQLVVAREIQLLLSTLLDTVKNRASLQARLDAQTRRDEDRQAWGDFPCWSDVTLQFVASFLDLPRPPPFSRANYERQLFERHILIGHNRAKQAQSNAQRKLLGLCQLCFSSVAHI